MATLRDIAAAWLAQEQSAILVEVRAARGSAPREAGTRMLVSAADFAGTVGGGHLEWQAIATARSMLEHAELAPSSQHYPLGPALGQCCGGAVTLGYSRLDASALNAWPDPQPRFELQLYGAGHVGRAIVRALAALHVRVDWIDEKKNSGATHSRPSRLSRGRTRRSAPFASTRLKPRCAMLAREGSTWC